MENRTIFQETAEEVEVSKERTPEFFCCTAKPFCPASKSRE